MGITFSHSLAGFAGFAATVVSPSSSADSSSIRTSIVLLLSFILLGVATVVFQRFIGEKGKQGPKRGLATESQMLQTLEHAIEEGRAGLDLDVAAPPNTHEEISSPPALLASQFDKALPEPKPEPKTEHSQIAQSALNGTNGNNGNNGNGFAHQPPNPARAGTAHVSLPRLSELRGMRFSQALRELDKAKRSAPANAGLNLLNGSLDSSLNDAVADEHNDKPDGALDDPIDDPINETLMSAIAPFEAMFASTASAPETQNGATAMHENGAAATKDNGAQGRPSVQTFFPPKPSLPPKSRNRPEENGGRSPRGPKAPETETNGYIDQLQILPSRRGQYKKKG
jgi:hypothetical protein